MERFILKLRLQIMYTVVVSKIKHLKTFKFNPSLIRTLLKKHFKTEDRTKRTN